MKLNNEERAALTLYEENFNSLPFEVRKGLPDLFTRCQETEKLIALQEQVLSKLRERRNHLREEFVKWYREQSK